MDHNRQGAVDIRSSLGELMMWSKGSGSHRALGIGMDVLLQRNFEEAAQEVKELDSLNNYSMNAVQRGAQAILRAGQ
jgi:hypothetical protein